MARVLVVNMPFCSLRWPAIGPSLLKAGLERQGIGCDVAYFSFDFAEAVGLAAYQWISDAFGFVLGGERVFAKTLFKDNLPDDETYYLEILRRADPELTAEERHEYEQTSRAVEPFLDRCLAQTDWSRYALVGFSTTFQQTVASLALARRIKEAHPAICIAMGGANCEGEMGRAILEQFSWIDFVFSGEADLGFPELAARLLAGGPAPAIPGMFVRGEPAPSGRAEPGIDNLVADLDALPDPDYDDYFRRLSESPLRDEIKPLLLFETARGCWWGEKRRCTFCGLNGNAAGFRAKSPGRAVEELRHLVERYGIRNACATDNIMDFRYYDTFLPALARANLGVALEYELKTNLSREQVKALVAAGLRAAQLGIETFLTPVLRLMRKGVTGIENLQTLKWFTEAGIEVKWNFLYGFPGERPEDYAALPELFSALVHLAPPQAAGQVRLDRFSSYFESPEAFGLANVRPNAAYRHVYPASEDVLARLAYYHEFDYADGRRPADYMGPALAALAAWQDQAPRGSLRYLDRSDGVLVLNDSRPGAGVFQRRLTGPERAAYLVCDTARSFAQIVAYVRQACGEIPDLEARLARVLDDWLATRIIVRLDDRYLSLALVSPNEPSASAGACQEPRSRRF
ncbi:MAG: RiPP maturation radical SAM C-methyltransferase [Pirellulales bacterium]